MTMTTLSSREFNQDTGRAKKAASEGPVFITDRGKPAHVLLSIEDYQRITGGHRKIADALAMPSLGDTGLGDTGLGDTGLGDTGLGDPAFDLPRVNIGIRPADFS